jgi:putative ABC transport system permease protein
MKCDWKRKIREASPGAIAPPPARTTWFTGLDHDVRYGLRVLARQPGPTMVGATTIALSIAAVTLVTSIVWSVLLKPLPWTEADQLVRVYEGARGGSQGFGQFGPIFTNSTYLVWQDQPATVVGLAAWRSHEVTLTGEGTAERLRIATVTASLAPLLRVEPLVGRWFESSDEPPSAPRRVVISHGLWMERFGGSHDAIGQALRFDGDTYTILGVMPQGFAFPDRHARAWRPLHVPPVVHDGLSGARLTMFSALARLKDGATPAQAAAEATARGRAMPGAGLTTMALFGSDGPLEVTAVRVREWTTREVRPALLALLAAVGLLLLTSAANVANLQLARATVRRREIAIRAALGAGTPRIARQLLIENVLLGLLGGVAGVLLAAGLHGTLPAILPADFPRLEEIALDWRAAVVAFGASAGAGLLTGLLPAFQARRLNLTGALADDAPSRAGGSGAVRLARAGVMAAQVASAIVLLVGAALLTRSFVAQLGADRGFDASNVLTAALPIPRADDSRERRNALLEAIVERVQGVPGVSAAGFTSILPLTGSESMRAHAMPGRHPGDPPVVNVRFSFRVVSPAYFAVMGMRIAQGRGLTETDSATSRPVAVVNRAFARAYLDDTSLGQVLPVGTDTHPDWEIVGIVEDVRPDLGAASPELFVSHRQWPEMDGGDPIIVVRTAGRPADLAPVLRAIVRDLDPSLALSSVRTMAERLDGELAKPRLYSVVLVTFGALALAIAGVGLFGVLSYAVAQRSRELAIRTALGAAPRHVVSLVLRQGLVFTGTGVVAGFAACVLMARLISDLLYGVTAVDHWSYLLAAGLVAAVALLACAVPARRAARADPAVVLRDG